MTVETKFNVSQSLMKAFAEYKLGKKCGLQFKAIYLDKVDFPPTDAMKLGNYFEFLCLGKLNRDGGEPIPDYTKAGELTAPYKRAKDHAIIFEKTVQKNGWAIDKKDTYYSHEGASMLLDAEVIIGEERVILDTKYSGLLNNKWEDYGWDIESLPNKEILTIQPIHYKWLWRQLHGQDIRFFWYVASSTNETEAKLIEAIVPEWKIDRHGEYVENVRGMIDREIDLGFVARPEIKRCADCAIKDTCPRFIDTPQLITVEI
jgi:hypothetical protein